MGANRWATMSKAGAKKRKPKAEMTPAEKKAAATKRRKLDDYETPEAQTELLCAHATFEGPIFECAVGSGRMSRELRRLTRRKVVGADIKMGKNFLDRKATFAGDIITNPPYRDGLADAFVQHALTLADGRVAMLMQSGFLHGSRRNEKLYGTCPPELIIIIPERVMFFKGGTDKRIQGQFFSNVWLVWPNRATRMLGGYPTVTVWPTVFDFG